MNRLIGNDFLQNMGRAIPTDRAQNQKPAIELGCKEVAKVQIKCLKRGIGLTQTQQFGSHADQSLGPSGT